MRVGLLCLVLLARGACSVEDRPQQAQPCHNLAAFSANPLVDTAIWLACLRAERTCSDAGPACAEAVCDTLIRFPNSGPTTWNAGILYYAWQVCPRTCGKCGGQRQGNDGADDRERSPCETGWFYADGQCLKLFHRHRPFLHSIVFDDAEEACQAEGAHLAEVDTIRKQHAAIVTIKWRPWYMRLRSWTHSAWIGLRGRGLTCSSNPEDWYWAASGRNLSNSSFTNWAPDGFAAHGVNHPWPRCKPGRSREECVVLNRYFGEHTWANVDCRTRDVFAWICSRPALVSPAGYGSCADIAMEPIRDFEACRAAAQSIGMYAPLVSWAAPRPEGCFFDHFGFTGFDPNPENHGRGSTLEERPLPSGMTEMAWRVQLCQQGRRAPTTNATADVPESAALGQTANEEDDALGRPGRLTVEVIATCCVLCFLLLALMVRRRGSLAAGALSAVRCARSWGPFARWGGCDAEPVDQDLETAVKDGLVQWRRRFAGWVAGALLVWRVGKFLRVRLTPGASCRVSHSTDLVLLGVEVSEALLACALLAADEGRLRSLLSWAWFLAVPALRVVSEAVLPTVVLLDAARLGESLLWRPLHGMTVSPPIALAVNAAYTVACILIHALAVPDGMYVLPDGGGCFDLITGADMTELVRLASGAMAHHRVASGLSSARDGLHGGLMQAFFQAAHNTSIRRFAQVEFGCLLVVAACILPLPYVMSKSLRRHLKLQGAEEQLAGVTEILEDLCDAVVSLNGSLDVAGPSPRFAHMLHCDASARGLASQGFWEHLAKPQEKDALHSALQAGRKAEGRASVYVTFKDTLGVSVPCQVFHASFKGVDGRPRHVLGINEVGEREQQPLAPLPHQKLGELPPERQRVDSQADGPQDLGGEGEATPVAPPPNDHHQEQPPGRQRSDAEGGRPQDAASDGSEMDSESAVRVDTELVSASSSEADASDAEECSIQVLRELDLQLSDLTIKEANAGAKQLFGLDPTDMALDEFIPFEEEWMHLSDWAVRCRGRIKRYTQAGPKVKKIGPLHLKVKRDSVQNTPLSGTRIYRVELDVEFPVPPADFSVETYRVTARILNPKRMREKRPAPLPSEGTANVSDAGPPPRPRNRRSSRSSASDQGGTPAQPAAAVLGKQEEELGEEADTPLDPQRRPRSQTMAI